MYKATKLAPLPYKNAPLGVYDLIKQQIEFEDRMYPHLEYKHSEEVMRKELPPQVWKPTARYVFGINIQRFAFLLP